MYAQPIREGFSVEEGIPHGEGHPTGIVNGLLPRNGQWSDGPCDCFNHCESLLLTFFCAPIRWSKTLARAKLVHTPYWRALLLFGLPWFMMSLLYGLLWYKNAFIYRDPDENGFLYWGGTLAATCNMCTIILGCSFRGRIREEYGIAGSCVGDCLMYTCCTCCAIAQEARHIDRDAGLVPV